MINSYIGIRQELKAKRTLDELAVLVAPHAKVVRDGAVVSLLAEEIVPGDMVAVEPGDQLVADGETLSTRGMTLDESMLTGEADGVRKGPGDRVALRLLLHQRLRLLQGRRGARGELRRASWPARRAPSATRPRRCRTRSTGDRRLRLRDGAAGGGS